MCGWMVCGKLLELPIKSLLGVKLTVINIYLITYSFLSQHTMQNMGARAHSPDPQEKKSTGAANVPSVSVSSEDEKKRKQFDPAEMFIKDWRSYRCKTWHLEPTVR